MTYTETGKPEYKKIILWNYQAFTYSLEFILENIDNGWIWIQPLGKWDFQQLNCRAAGEKKNKKRKKIQTPKFYLSSEKHFLNKL